MRAHPHATALATKHGPFPSDVLERAAADLEAAALARENQLSNLPTPTTPVAVAHRESVRRILDSIRAAQAQLAAGTYGSCHRCGRRADPATALARPWAPRCATCDLG